ncbi:MAG: DUF4349 domain-containing protein, partial [Candidatus Nanohaloarchaea archaeon]|nr:DUF4349 domain-containing protein [Candidatus Nanohaloarchaea archaeon]
MDMDVDALAGNRYLLGAVALVAVLVTGLLVQGGGPVGMQQSATASYDGGKARLALAGGAGGDALAEEAEAGDGDTARKRVTRVDMDIDVPDVLTAQSEIESMVARYGGYVQDTSIDREFGDTGRMEVRIPEGNLSAFTGDVEGRWTVDSRSTNVQDVTQRYTELRLELKNKRQELRRLEQLMNRTDNVSDLIEIQERMGELRSRIQYLENEFSQLQERVAYATVTIHMEEASTFESRFELRRAVTEAYRGVFSSLNLMIVGTGYLLPFAVLLALVYLGKRKW